jgi:UDP-glucose-4-epimerase GalE
VNTQPRPNILVTGGAGFIGSHTCKALAGAGYTPIAYDNLSVGHRCAVQWGPLVKADIGDEEILVDTLKRYKISSVIHFAASAYVGESMLNPRKYFNNNLANSLTLLNCILDEKVKDVIFSSTCATYGIPCNIPIDEAQPQHPINPYGESKLAVERLLHWYGAQYGLRWVALRYFNAAGADPDGEIGESHEDETHLIPLALEAAENPERAFSLFGIDHPTPDGTAIRDFIHVSDLARAHVCALHYLERAGGSRAFNLGTGQGHSVAEVIKCVEEVTGKPLKVRIAPRRAGDPPILTADASGAREHLFWSPNHSSLEEIVLSAWNWMGRTVPVAARAQAPANSYSVHPKP